MIRSDDTTVGWATSSIGCSHFNHHMICTKPHKPHPFNSRSSHHLSSERFFHRFGSCGVSSPRTQPDGKEKHLTHLTPHPIPPSLNNLFLRDIYRFTALHQASSPAIALPARSDTRTRPSTCPSNQPAHITSILNTSQTRA